MTTSTDAAPLHQQGHFKGIAVVIDDQVHAEPEIIEIIEAIEAAGGHVVRLDKLPSDGTDFENFTGAAFFILDWNLVELGPGIKLPEGVAAEQVSAKVEFLRRLRRHRHAPVFIFTKEDPEVEREALLPYADLYQEATSSILIRQKTAVGKQVYSVLNDWAKDLPSVLALKSWERENHRAINGVFNDLHDRDHLWPVFMWKTFKDDSLTPRDELGRLITRLVTSRMSAPDVNLDRFLPELESQLKANPVKYRESLLSILEGERFLRNERLDPESYTTGDVFLEGGANGATKYYINLRAECDCIKHTGTTPGSMHLLGGFEAPDALDKVDPKFGQVPEQDNEGVVVAMFNGKHIRFAFNRNLKVQAWNATWKGLRIGRLLPPFLTRLLERYAAYSHRPGIPRVPSVLVPQFVGTLGAIAPEEDSADASESESESGSGSESGA